METRHVSYLSSSRPASCNIPVAVGSYNGLHVVAYPPSRSHVQESRQGPGDCGSNAEILLHSVVGDQNHWLSGHNDEVQALSFSEEVWSSPSEKVCSTWLCSVSPSSVLLWNVNQLLSGERSCQLLGELADDHSIAPAHSVRFSPSGGHVAICRGDTALVYDTQRCVLDTTLIGHSAKVLQTFFISSHPVTVATLSEDHTFKVWNLDMSSLTYQSHIISSVSRFVCGAVHMAIHHLVTATEDGMLRTYDLTRGSGYKCILKTDVIKDLDRLKLRGARDYCSEQGSKTICSSGSAVTTPSTEDTGPSTEEGEGRGEVECSSRLVDIFYIHQQACDSADNTGIRQLLQSTLYLLVVAQQQVLRYKGQTLELLDQVDFTVPQLSMDPSGFSWQQVPVIGSCDLVCTSSEGVAGTESPPTMKVLLAVGGVFTSTVTLVTMDIGTEQVRESSQEARVLSVLSSQPLLPTSPLRAEFTLKTTSSSAKGCAGKGLSKSRSQPGTARVLNQPLTFKSKVKSSGYSATPRRIMFKQQGGSSPGKGSSRSSPRSDVSVSYPASAGPTIHLGHSLKMTDRSAAIFTTAFSSSGRDLMCGAADHGVYHCRGHLFGKVSPMLGHNGVVLSCGWSHNEDLLVSGSSDRTARVWSVATPTSTSTRSHTHSRDYGLVMVIDTINHNFKHLHQATSHSKTSSNPEFSKDLSFAQFYYLDKFLLLTSGNSAYLYKYHIDSERPDDIKRYQSSSHYKCVTSVGIQSAQAISAMSAINDFHSYVLLLAGSDRRLEVHDMNVGKCVRVTPDTHTRPVHWICQNKGSRFISHGSENYDIFATSALTDGIKIWDTRSNRCVQKYTSHVNSSQPSILACFSPCSRYLATGSEDNSAYIYDLRGSTPVHRLARHSDSVTAVAYHPMKPLLVTCTMDGQMRCYSDIK